METPETHRDSARAALDMASVLVTKIGGENAADLRGNFRTIEARRAEGKKQILAISALRSTDPQWSPYAHPDVADRDSLGRVKQGFNTTSHLIALARAAERGDGEQTEDLLQRVRHFTRDIVERQLVEEGWNGEAVGRLHAVIDRTVNALRCRLTQDGECEVLELGQDWVLRDGRGYPSLTGLGETLAQEIYSEYLALKHSPAQALRFDGAAEEAFGENPREVAENEDRTNAAIATLRGRAREQLRALLPDADVLIAGGYLPVLGGQRGYSDKTGALLTQAAQDAGERTAYIVEKQEPIKSADPRIIGERARTVEEMTYDLAMEAFGNVHGADGGVVHPQALAMLAHADIDTFVLNPARATEGNITRIHRFAPQPRGGIEIVASRRMPVAVRVQSTKMFGRPGFLERMSDWFAEHGISIDQVFTTEVTITFTFTNGGLRPGQIEEFQNAMQQEFADEELALDVIRNKALVFCLGNDLRGLQPIADAVRGIAEAGIEDVDSLVRSTRQVIAFTIDESQAEAALTALHRTCIEERGGGIARDEAA